MRGGSLRTWRESVLLSRSLDSHWFSHEHPLPTSKVTNRASGEQSSPPTSMPYPCPVWAPRRSTESSGWVTASTPHILSVSQEGKASHPRRRSPRTPLDHVTLTNTRVGRRNQEFTADSPAPSCLSAVSQQNAALGAGSPGLGGGLRFVGNLMQWEFLSRWLFFLTYVYFNVTETIQNIYFCTLFSFTLRTAIFYIIRNSLETSVLMAA